MEVDQSIKICKNKNVRAKKKQAKYFDFFESQIDGDHDPEILAMRLPLIGQNKFPVAKLDEHWTTDPLLSSWMQPLGMERFVKKVWNRSHYHFKAKDPHRFSAYLSLQKLGSMLAENRFPHSKIKFVNSNQKTQKVNEIDSVTLARKVFLEGGSLVIDDLSLYDLSISELAERFAFSSKQEIGVNLYLTPGGGKTFPWHWDSHDVFILQIEGLKEWEIFEAAYSLPLENHNFHSFPNLNSSNSKMVERLTLAPGDILYLPRGTPHSGKSASLEHSLHLSFGLYPITWQDVVSGAMSQAIRNCEKHLEFRSYFPTSPGASLLPKNIQTLKKLINKVFNEVDYESIESAVISHQARNSRPNICRNLAVWESLARHKRINSQTLLRKSGPQFFIKHNAENTSELRYGKTKIVFDGCYFATLVSIEKDETFCVETLPSKGVPKGGNMALVNLLYEKGLLAISEGA